LFRSREKKNGNINTAALPRFSNIANHRNVRAGWPASDLGASIHARLGSIINTGISAPDLIVMLIEPKDIFIYYPFYQKIYPLKFKTFKG